MSDGDIMIFAIKPFEIHDGDGIRTTVFFKGCPLRCKWCHNPESFIDRAELAFWEHKCLNCGKCIKLCDAHYFENSIHKFDQTKCIACGKCVEVCPVSALKLYGYEIEVDELIDEITKDYDFYAESGGGITLSGGEPLLHAEYCAELLMKLKQKDINTAVDTCGYVSQKAIDKVLPYTDTFLYDIKAIDEDVHIECCGVSNKIILENLLYIDSKGKKIEVRIPYVPEMNDSQIKKIGLFLKDIKNLVRVRVLKYHNLATDKYRALGNVYPLEEIPIPSNKDIEDAITVLKSYGINAMASDD